MATTSHSPCKGERSGNMLTPTPETDAFWQNQCCSGLSWFTIACNMKDFARKLERERDEALKWQEPKLARNQPCGCVICICEGDDRCSGCGAKNCGNHLPGEIPNPVFEPHPLVAERDQLRKVCDELYACGCDCSACKANYSTLSHVIKAKGKQ